VGAVVAGGVINVFFSGSRAAILGLAVAILGVAWIAVFAPGSAGARAKRLAIVSALLVISAAAVTVLLPERLEFLRFRNEALLVAYYSGENRFADVTTVLETLRSNTQWVFGVANAEHRRYVSYGVEVEPVFLLVNYGVLGVALRYGLLALIVRRALALMFTRRQIAWHIRQLGMVCTLGVVTYAAFSLGYFFFHELAVAGFPWLVFGIAVGANSDRSEPSAT
jgi:hypothetical protein